MKFSKILLLSILCFAQTVFANQPKLSFFNEMEEKDFISVVGVFTIAVWLRLFKF